MPGGGWFHSLQLILIEGKEYCTVSSNNTGFLKIMQVIKSIFFFILHVQLWGWSPRLCERCLNSITELHPQLHENEYFCKNLFVPQKLYEVSHLVLAKASRAQRPLSLFLLFLLRSSLHLLFFRLNLLPSSQKDIVFWGFFPLIFILMRWFPPLYPWEPFVKSYRKSIIILIYAVYIGLGVLWCRGSTLPIQ